MKVAERTFSPARTVKTLIITVYNSSLIKLVPYYQPHGHSVRK